MKIKTTKTLAAALNKEAQKQHVRMWFDCIALPTYDYSKIVSYRFEDMERDYDMRTGKCKAIKIVYPDDYALPEYVTTNDLLRIADCIARTIYDPLTVENFAKHVFEEYEI